MTREQEIEFVNNTVVRDLREALKNRNELCERVRNLRHLLICYGTAKDIHISEEIKRELMGLDTNTERMSLSGANANWQDRRRNKKDGKKRTTET